jgi:hypothetical protein
LTPPFWQCPAIGLDTSCGFVIDATGSPSNPTLTVISDPTQNYYEGSDDVTVAVQNDTSGNLSSVHVGIAGTGDNVFGFDGDGICNPGVGTIPTGCPFGGTSNSSDPFDYYGPDMSFAADTSPCPGATIGPCQDDGTVNFNPPLTPGQYTFFGLEAPPSSPTVPVGSGNDYLSSSLSDGGTHTGARIAETSPTNVTDQATLNGTHASTANGTISYKVYSDPACTHLVTDATPSPNTVTTGLIPPSNAVGAASPFANNATYYWQVTYTPGSGDLNSAATSACGDEAMTFGTPPRPANGITTTLASGTQSGASISVAPNAPVTDSATITGPGANTATGTVTFTVYTDSACTAANQITTAFPLHGDIRNVVNGASPPSAAVTFAKTGTYYFKAVYSGDATHSSAASTCGSEVVTVKTPTTLSTSFAVSLKPMGPTASVPPDTKGVTDTAAVLANGLAATGATGTVAYALYDSSIDRTCAKTPIATGGGALTLGAAPAFALPALKPGKYFVVATYSGDATYLGSVSGCGVEVLTVNPISLAVKAGHKKKTIVDKVDVNAAGKLSVTATFGPKGKFKFGSASHTTTGAATFTLKISPSAAARIALLFGHRIRVTEKFVFKPADGAAEVKLTVTVTV